MPVDAESLKVGTSLLDLPLTVVVDLYEVNLK